MRLAHRAFFTVLVLGLAVATLAQAQRPERASAPVDARASGHAAAGHAPARSAAESARTEVEFSELNHRVAGGFLVALALLAAATPSSCSTSSSR